MINDPKLHTGPSNTRAVYSDLITDDAGGPTEREVPLSERRAAVAG